MVGNVAFVPPDLEVAIVVVIIHSEPYDVHLVNLMIFIIITIGDLGHEICLTHTCHGIILFRRELIKIMTVSINFVIVFIVHQLGGSQCDLFVSKCVDFDRRIV